MANIQGPLAEICLASNTGRRDCGKPLYAGYVSRHDHFAANKTTRRLEHGQQTNLGSCCGFYYRLVCLCTMERSFDLSDSTDWLRTPLAALAPVESALRCQVCKDFFDTPMITSCSHTFCSLCIRRCLTEDGKCPACRAADQELRLRRNWTVQELVDAFRDARSSVLQLGQDVVAAAAARPKNHQGHKRKLEDTDAEEDGNSDHQRRKTRSQSQKSSKLEQTNEVFVIEDDVDNDYRPGIYIGVLSYGSLADTLFR